MPCVLIKGGIFCYSYIYQIYSTKAERSWWLESGGWLPVFVNKDGNESKVQPWGGIIGEVANWILDNKCEFDRCIDQIYLASDGWQYEITRIN